MVGVVVEILEVQPHIEHAPPIVDFDKMAENSKKLGEYCGKNPDHSVITAADKVMGNGK